VAITADKKLEKAPASRQKAPARGTVVVVSLVGPTIRVLQAAMRGKELIVQRSGSAPSAADPEARAKAVAKALAEAGIKERRVVICLPVSSLAIKRVQLPPASPDQLPQLIAFEAQRHLPLPLEELASGYRVLGSTGNGSGPPGDNEVLLAVARKAELSRLEKALAASGISVEGYGVDALAVTDAYLPFAEPPNGHARLILAPDVGGVHAQVLHGRRLLFNRFLSPGGADWTPDLQRSLAAYSMEYPELPVGEVVLLGDADDAAIQRAANAPVRRAPLNPARLGGMSVPADWASLVGLAGQWLGIGQFPLRIPAQGWEGAGRAQSQWAALAVIVLVAALAAWGVSYQLDRQKTQRAETEKAQDEARRTAADRKKLARETEERDRLLKQLAAMSGREAAPGTSAESLEPGSPPLELLRRVTARAPQDLWLTQMTYQSGQPLRIQGTARDAATIPLFVHSLEGTPGFGKVDLGYMRSATVEKQPVTHFRVDCTLSEKKPAPEAAPEDEKEPPVVPVEEKQP
jgi:Tfp pilus assembly protein PilN